jgi:hypothetical protein
LANYKIDFLENYTIFSDAEELAVALLKSEVVSVLGKYPDLFVSLHFSDNSQLFPNFAKSLRFEYNLPTNMSEMSDLMEMTLFFVDLLTSLQLPQKILNVSLEKRKELLMELEKEKESEKKSEIERPKIKREVSRKEKLEEKKLKEKKIKENQKKEIEMTSVNKRKPLIKK